MLYVQAKITKRNGTALEATTVVAPVNLFLHSLFSQVDISLNGTQVTSSTNTYPYRAMLKTLLSYGGDAKKSQLTSAMYYEDQPGRMDAFTVDNVDTRNSGLVERRKFTTQSKTVDMIGIIHADMFFQSRYLLNEVDVKIKLTRSRDEFCTMSAADEKSKVKIVCTVCSKSQTVSLRRFGTCESTRVHHGKVSYQSRGVQDVDDSDTADGCQSPEAFFRTDSDSHRRRNGAQRRFQRTNYT